MTEPQYMYMFSCSRNCQFSIVLAETVFTLQQAMYGSSSHVLINTFHFGHSGECVGVSHCGFCISLVSIYNIIFNVHC